MWLHFKDKIISHTQKSHTQNEIEVCEKFEKLKLKED